MDMVFNSYNCQYLDSSKQIFIHIPNLVSEQLKK